MNKYLNTLIKLVELPRQNKEILPNGDCAISKTSKKYYRPCEFMQCDDCIFAKTRESHQQGLKILNEQK